MNKFVFGGEIFLRQSIRKLIRYSEMAYVFGAVGLQCIPAVPKGASKKLYPSDFLRLSNRKDLYGNNEIYRMPVERGALSTKFRFLLICISVC